jgi:hypothetical protein
MVLRTAGRRFFATEPRVVAFVGATVLTAILGSSACADAIMLRGGGQVQGKVIPDPDNKDRVQVWLMQGRKPLSFLKSQIEEVVPKSGPLDLYFAKIKTPPTTAVGQYELGNWCDENKLVDLAKVHYETAVSIDKNFEPAHKKLKHVFRNGYWLTSPDELKAVEGLVKYKGRWVSTEEKAKLEALDQASAVQTSWIRRIRILRQALLSGSEARQREAEAQLMAIREAEAVGPLCRVFGADEPPQRILLAQVLAGIPGKEASLALARQLLAEPSEAVRPSIMDRLKDRNEPAVTAHLVRALNSSDIPVVNRAAWALGNLGTTEIVPKLIPALLSYEQRIVMVPKGNAVSPAFASYGMSMTPLAYNGSFIALQTPPVVAPGVVAYGITTAPVLGTPLAPANIGAQINTQPEPTVVTFTYRNTEVLAALTKMTGQDFGYDIDSWRHWVSREFNPAPNPGRRVLKP